VEAGQVFLWNYLEVSAEPLGLASRISPGERAVTIGVDRKSGLESMLRPGNRVDVIATFNFPGEKNRRVSRTLLQNVTVLATGNDDGAGQYSTVTFQLSPEEAELMAFAEGVAEIKLSLRGNRDVEVKSSIPVVDFSNLMKIQKDLNARQRKKGRPKVIYN
jgi:pilus assembly protein CpaB